MPGFKAEKNRAFKSFYDLATGCVLLCSLLSSQGEALSECMTMPHWSQTGCLVDISWTRWSCVLWRSSCSGGHGHHWIWNCYQRQSSAFFPRGWRSPSGECDLSSGLCPTNWAYVVHSTVWEDPLWARCSWRSHLPHPFPGFRELTT